MPSIADGSSFRRFLLLALIACCFFALQVQAQTASQPCGADAPAPDLLTATQPQPTVQLAALQCGAAGQICCPFNRPCNPGLACNANNVCRTCGGAGNICCSGNTCSSGLTCNNGRCEAPPPCGGPNQACCAGGVCTFGTACERTSNTCLVCGFYGEFCCPGITSCYEGTCKVPGTCQP
jgi:hypothetical protein